MMDNKPKISTIIKNVLKNKWVIIGIILFLLFIGYKVFMTQLAIKMAKMQASMPSSVEVKVRKLLCSSALEKRNVIFSLTMKCAWWGGRM